MNWTRILPPSEGEQEEEEQEEEEGGGGAPEGGGDRGPEGWSLPSSSATPRATLLALPPGDLLVEGASRGRDESRLCIPGASIGRHPPGSGIEGGKESTCAMTSMT